jgi:hypothetical protein
MEDEGKQKLLRTAPFFFVRVLLTCHLSENRKDKSQSVKHLPNLKLYFQCLSQPRIGHSMEDSHEKHKTGF